MGRVLMTGGGGGGGSSDDCTATANDILKGKTAVYNGSGDESQEGTLELTGDAAVVHVLKGKTFYNNDPHAKLAGTIESMAGNTYIPSASQQTIRVSGKYMTSDIIIPGFTMPPANVIKQGTTITTYYQSVTGTYNGYGVYEEVYFWNKGNVGGVVGTGNLGFGSYGQVYSDSSASNNTLTTPNAVDLRRYNRIFVWIGRSAAFQHGSVDIYRISSGKTTYICSFSTTSIEFGYTSYNYDLSLPGQLKLVFTQQGTGILAWGVQNVV